MVARAQVSKRSAHRPEVHCTESTSILFSFICGLRRLFVIPFPGGNESNLREGGTDADIGCTANDAAPIEISKAFKKLRRERERRDFFLIWTNLSFFTTSASLQTAVLVQLRL